MSEPRTPTAVRRVLSLLAGLWAATTPALGRAEIRDPPQLTVVTEHESSLLKWTTSGHIRFDRL